MMKICYHCSNPIKTKIITNQDKEFCCNGCLAVYQLLSKEGFLDFYKKKGDIPLAYLPEELPDSINQIYNEKTLSEFIQKENGMFKISLIFDGITCPACIWLLEKITCKSEGVETLRISHSTHKGTLIWNPEKIRLPEIIGTILKTGYKVYINIPSIYMEKQKIYENDLLIRLGTAFFFMMNIMIISAGLYAGYFQKISTEYKKVFHYLLFFLSTPVVFYSGYPIIQGAYVSLREKILNMNVLVSIGVLSAYFYSAAVTMTGTGEVYFETSSAIVFLVLSGRYIEARIKSNASNITEKFLKLSPKEAVRLKEGREERVPHFAIEIADILKVKPAETVPADGIIIEGVSSLDESFLTGESFPVSKKIGDEVFAGSVNLDGMILIKAAKKSDDMLVNKISKLVEEAELLKAPVERIADRLSGFFTIAVVIIFLVTIAFWLLKTGDIEQALTCGISVLIISCPCALGLATPTAISASIGSGALNGIIFKSGEVLENLSKVNKVCFDKTGTITTGKIEIINVIPFEKMSKDEILLTSASLEANSTHPIAKAFKHITPLKVNDFTEFPGEGVTGVINGVRYYLGSAPFLKKMGLEAEAVNISNTGKSIISLFNEKKVLGVISIGDKIRKDAREAIKKLKEMGLATAILSGDLKPAVKEAAEELNVDEYHAQMLPEEKLAYIENSRKRGFKVLMAGDGINDTPSLKYADAGIAVCSAVDRTVEASDIIMTKNDLNFLPQAIMISKRGLEIIRQNLIFASIYNLIAIPAAAAGLLLPVFSAVAMTLSSITVVANSARIKKDKVC